MLNQKIHKNIQTKISNWDFVSFSLVFQSKPFRNGQEKLTRAVGRRVSKMDVKQPQLSDKKSPSKNLTKY